MGACGCGSFENDDAADWVYEFESSGVVAAASALEHVSSIVEDEYLETPEASAAIAAARLWLRLGTEIYRSFQRPLAKPLPDIENH